MPFSQLRAAYFSAPNRSTLMMARNASHGARCQGSLPLSSLRPSDAARSSRRISSARFRKSSWSHAAITQTSFSQPLFHPGQKLRVVAEQRAQAGREAENDLLLAVVLAPFQVLEPLIGEDDVQALVQ